MAKFGNLYHMLDTSVISKIINTAEQEPKPEDADENKQVVAFNKSKQSWELRFWFDFIFSVGVLKIKEGGLQNI